ncbi:MAG: response regulator transcription factor [Jatrophihabitantaceae bacterium]
MVVGRRLLNRAGVVELLRTMPAIEVACEAASGGEATALARRQRPDVVVLQTESSELHPGPTIMRMRLASPKTEVIVLPELDSAELLREVIESGASGYLTVDATRAELRTAILAAARRPGMTMIASSRRSLLGLLTCGASSSMLSPRETEVLNLLAQAMSNHQIGAALQISDGTVKRHLTNIYAKLDATSRIDAVRKARDARVISRE